MPLEPDGMFGPQTLSRVRAFQAQGSPVLVPDGIVGPLTWAKLLEETGGDVTTATSQRSTDLAAVAGQILAAAGNAPGSLASVVALLMAGQGGRRP